MARDPPYRSNANLGPRLQEPRGLFFAAGFSYFILESLEFTNRAMESFRGHEDRLALETRCRDFFPFTVCELIRYSALIIRNRKPSPLAASRFHLHEYKSQNINLNWACLDRHL